MPKVIETPTPLKPYVAHGLDLAWGEGRTQAVGDCPFCGREGKFFVGLEDGGKDRFAGGWDCKVCGERGNVLTFLRRLWERSRDNTGDSDDLAEARGLLNGDTPMLWGAARSILDGEWLVPGYSADGKIVQLYRWVPVGRGKRSLMATPGTSHGIFGISPIGKMKKGVHIVEGYWNALVLWETMRQAREGNGGGLMTTAAEGNSLLAESTIIAVPGANVFNESWCSLLSDRVVTLLYDSDHPKLHCQGCKRSWSRIAHGSCPQCRGPLTGPEVPSTGFEGARRAARILSASTRPPSEIHYLAWGEDGYDPEMDSGHDIRDALTTTRDLDERVRSLGRLLDRISPIPEGWIPGRSSGSSARGSTEIQLLPCDSWRRLTDSWRIAVKWTDGIDRSLACMMASILSTPHVGEQLWVMVLGAASSLKTTLCEAVSTNRKYIYPTDTFSKLVSGYQVDKHGSENLSMVNHLHNRTLVINDGDTLLRLPNREQVLSQLRAFYGRNIRSQFANKMSRNFEGINTTIILAGTGSLMELDSSELGSRFIICDIGRLDEETEEEVGWRVAMRADQEIVNLSDGKLESRDAPELVEAKRLTGGYVEYLRTNSAELLSSLDPTSEETLKRCQRLGRLVSFMRARPPKKQDEITEREMPFRLIAQYVRLAKCLAVVLNRRSIDEPVLERVKQIALDTARGKTFKIIRHLKKYGKNGSPMSHVAQIIHDTDDKAKSLLRFLHQIGAVDPFIPVSNGVRGTVRYRLTEVLASLYSEVMADGKGEGD